MNWGATGAILMALGVMLGAFGAHALKDRLDAYSLDVYQKAVFYHFIHAVMLFILAERPQLPRLAWWSFLGGIVIFSGSLYLLAVTDTPWLGAITPIGGLLFLMGWGSLFFRSVRDGRGDRRGDDDGRGPAGRL